MSPAGNAGERTVGVVSLIVRPVASVVLAALAIAPAATPVVIAQEPDLSRCNNCDEFPAEWLEVDETERLDLASLPPERRLDFLVGEWEVFYPYRDDEAGEHFTTDQPVGYDLFEWFVPNRVLEGFQEWPFTSGGGRPFRAKTDFRYIAGEERWQMIWLTGGSTGVYTGGLEQDGALAFHEHEFRGDHRVVRTTVGARYVFHNITRDRFIAEWWLTEDGGRTYPFLEWRVMYRRRESPTR